MVPAAAQPTRVDSAERQAAAGHSHDRATLVVASEWIHEVDGRRGEGDEPAWLPNESADSGCEKEPVDRASRHVFAHRHECGENPALTMRAPAGETVP